MLDEDDDDVVSCTSYADRYTRCTMRHLVLGDRPRFVDERIFLPLFHRCRHVVAADRAKPRGQLSNIALTHSGLKDDGLLEGEHGYDTFAAHSLRAGLVPPSGAGVEDAGSDRYCVTDLTMDECERLYAQWTSGLVSLEAIQDMHGPAVREFIELQRIAEARGLELQVWEELSCFAWPSRPSVSMDSSAGGKRC